jgi:uncharacterized UPF0160 family protein
MGKISELVINSRLALSKKKSVTLLTHGGRFHSDDVASTVILKKFFLDNGFDVKVIRTYQYQEYVGRDDCIIYDIGLGEYDHHQVGDAAEHCKRKDGKKHAAVGLIWKEIGQYIVDDRHDFEFISRTIIDPISDQDNGNGKNPLSEIIGMHNQDSNDPEQNAKEFEAACKYFEIVWDVVLRKVQNNVVAREEFEHYIYNQDEFHRAYLITDKKNFGAPAYEYCRDKGIPFYIYPNPRQEGSYSFEAVAIDPDSYEHFIDIPDKVRTWEGVIFLHPTCFVGSAISRERAIEICRKLCDQINF